MKRLLFALGVLACLAVATRTVTVRATIMRAGYERAGIERQLREERELTRCLEAEIAGATCRSALLERADALGVKLVVAEPGQVIVAPRPAFVEDAGAALVRR